MRQQFRVAICGVIVALCLAACGLSAAPTPLPTLSAAERQAQIAQMTQVAIKLTATAETRAATATAAAVPTVALTPTPTTIRPTTAAKPGSGALPNVTANLKDFKLRAYQGDASLGSGEVLFSNVFAYRLPVIVNIWAPLCAPCRQEMPAFQRVSNDFAGRAFFMGLDIGTYMPGLGDQAQAAQFLKDIGVNYPNAFPIESPLRAYNIRSVPTTLYFAPDGKLVHTDVGALTEDGLRENVQTLVQLFTSSPLPLARSWPITVQAVATFASSATPLPLATQRRRFL
jgi:thiol-disulfide isomerase/thioredoxin